MKNAPDKKSVLFLNLAVMLFGLSGVIAKFISASPVTITFSRALLSSFLLFCIMLIKREGFQLKLRKDALQLVLSGVLLALHWTAFFQSIKTASVAIGTITFSTFPLFLIVLEPLLFHERFRVRNLVYAAVLLCGVLITVPEFSLSNQTTAGILWGMAGSFTYALLVLINRDLSARYSGIKICMYEQAVAAAVLLPAVVWVKERIGANDVAGIVAIGALCTALGFSLFVTAQKKVSAQTAGIISGMETVYGILFAFLFLGASPSMREIVGGTIILGVAAVSSWKQEDTTRYEADDSQMLKLISEQVSNAVQSVLHKNIIGTYLTGSAVLGDWHYGKSDLDLIILIHDVITKKDRVALQKQINRLQIKYAGVKFEIQYIPITAVGKCKEDAAPILAYHDNKHSISYFNLNPVTWYILKKYGAVVWGKPIDELHLETQAEELTAYVCENINTYWAMWVASASKTFSRKSILSLTDRAVEWCVCGISRMYYTLQEKDITSKNGAIDYMMQLAPPEHSCILREAQSIRLQTKQRFFSSRFKRRKSMLQYMFYVIELCRQSRK